MHTRWLPIVLLAGCIDGPGDPVAPPSADYDLYVDTVHPVFESSCSNPSCHGNGQRPFEVFAARRNRLDPAELYRATPLSDEELALDFERSCGFLVDLDRAEDCALLNKPLAPSAGGTTHGGETQFADREEPGYQAILRWVDLALESP
jgi:hypothetical protein